jgi:hypothetical protein
MHAGLSARLEQSQCAAWQRLYHSTSGKEWLHCAGNLTDPCACNCGGKNCGTYVRCAGGADITTIFLNNIGMRGALPDVSELTALTALSVPGNAALQTLPYLPQNGGGSSPADLNALPALLCGLTSLGQLSIYGTSITGMSAIGLRTLLPTCLCTDLPKLHLLTAGGMGLSGTLPDELSQLTLLQVQPNIYIYFSQTHTPHETPNSHAHAHAHAHAPCDMHASHCRR